MRQWSISVLRSGFKEMESLVPLLNKYYIFFEKYSDKRTTNWFLMASPLPILLITIFYVFAVKVLIPKYMKNRKAFRIRNYLRIYNFWHLSVCLIYAYILCTMTYFAGYSWRCEAIDRSPFGKPLNVKVLLGTLNAIFLNK